MREITSHNVNSLDFTKGENNLLPTIVQDKRTRKVLMLGYMNAEAIEETLKSKKVTFFSRSKKRLWTKGETSENYLHLCGLFVDCDNDALLAKVFPAGATCHTGADTCWDETNEEGLLFLERLQQVIESRKQASEDTSYTSKLFKSGTGYISRKVGEEAVETIVEAMSHNGELLQQEAADLIYHLAVLLSNEGLSLEKAVAVLAQRHKEAPAS